MRAVLAMFLLLRRRQRDGATGASADRKLLPSSAGTSPGTSPDNSDGQISGSGHAAAAAGTAGVAGLPPVRGPMHDSAGTNSGRGRLLGALRGFFGGSPSNSQAAGEQMLCCRLRKLWHVN